MKVFRSIRWGVAFLQAGLTICALCFHHHISLPPPCTLLGVSVGSGRALSSSSLAAEEGRASFPHQGLAGLSEATAAFVTDAHSRSVEPTNATRTRVLYSRTRFTRPDFFTSWFYRHRNVLQVSPTASCPGKSFPKP